MGGLSEGIILKALGVLGGVVMLAYANHWSMRFHQKEFNMEVEERKKQGDKIEEVKTNTIKNCSDIKHLQDRFNKLEDRCYERHTE